MSAGWTCRRLHHHDNRQEAADCDALTDETPAPEPEAEEPIVSPEEHAAAVAEARRRLEEGRRK